MTKKIMAVLLICCLVISNVTLAFANEEETVEQIVKVAEESSVLELSLEEAIAMALENNPQIEASDAAIKSSELSYELAADAKKEIDKIEKYTKIAVNVSEGLETGYLKHGYYKDAANVGVELNKMAKEQVIASVAYQVTERYYNVKLMEQLVEISKTGLSIAEDNSNVVKKNYELGYVSELEVKNVDNAVLKSKQALESYERNLEIATKSLKISLMIEESDCELVLTDEIVLPQMIENVTEKIDGAVETRYDCTALKKSYDLAERYFEITDYYVNEKTAVYNSAYSDYLNAKYTYENSVKLIKLGLESQYAAMITAKDNITSCENDLAIKEVEYESAKIKYEMGLITNLELTSVMAELDGAKVQLENAQVTYLLNVLKFQYDITIGL